MKLNISRRNCEFFDRNDTHIYGRRVNTCRRRLRSQENAGCDWCWRWCYSRRFLIPLCPHRFSSGSNTPFKSIFTRADWPWDWREIPDQSCKAVLMLGQNEYDRICYIVNHLHPRIRWHILHIVLFTFPVVQSRVFGWRRFIFFYSRVLDSWFSSDTLGEVRC